MKRESTHQKILQKANEIVSLNPQVQELSTLIELDEKDLEEIAGGGSCCGVNGGCVFDCKTHQN